MLKTSNFADLAIKIGAKLVFMVSTISVAGSYIGHLKQGSVEIFDNSFLSELSHNVPEATLGLSGSGGCQSDMGKDQII